MLKGLPVESNYMRAPGSDNTLSEIDTGLPWASQPCNCAALPVMFRRARCSRTIFVGLLIARYLAALRVAADRLIRVSRLSSSSGGVSPPVGGARPVVIRGRVVKHALLACQWKITTDARLEDLAR